MQLAPIDVSGASYRDIDLRELLAGAGAEFQEGNLRMTYQGKFLQLGSQVKLIDEEKSLIWEEQFVEPAAKYVSSRLEGVWWMPSNNYDTKFIISNTTDAPVTAIITIDGTSPGQQTPAAIQLNAHETRVLDVIRDLVGKNNGTIHTTGGVSISHTGAAGAVLARMLISKANKGFSSTMNFIDPQMTASSKWHGAGLHLGKINNKKLRQTLVARNVGGETTVVSGKIHYTNDNGEVVSIDVSPTNIAPNSTKTINLQNSIDAANVPASVKYAGLEMSYITAHGSVVMSAVSISQDENQVFQVPLFDPQKTPTSAGGYPWKTDGDFTTIVYIKNETDEPKRYIADLIYEGGGYTLGIREIKAHETTAIDFRALRDAQTPDAMGNVIPLNIGKGQIGWSVKGRENRTLSGRSEQISPAKGISSTYDCRLCCPVGFFDGEITPFSVVGNVGDVTNFIGVQQDVNCYGQLYPPHPANIVRWQSTDPTVARCNYFNGQTTALSPGETMIQGSWTADSWFDDGFDNCDYIPIEVLEEAFCDVISESADFTLNAPSTAKDGDTVQFSVSNFQNGTPTAYEWTFTSPSGAGNNPQVNFTQPTMATTAVTAHWFASPDQPCASIPPDPSSSHPYYNSTYKIKVKVTFSNGSNRTKEANFTVNAWWSPAGQVDPNKAGISGVPLQVVNNGVWSVGGLGSLTRVRPPKEIFVSTTSQFYNKTNVHETEHFEHWDTGNLLGHLFIVADYYSRIQNFTASSQRALINQLGAELVVYLNEEGVKYGRLRAESERRAYVKSDPISPKYAYQNCGQYP